MVSPLISCRALPQPGRPRCRWARDRRAVVLEPVGVTVTGLVLLEHRRKVSRSASLRLRRVAPRPSFAGAPMLQRRCGTLVSARSARCVLDRDSSIARAVDRHAAVADARGRPRVSSDGDRSNWSFVDLIDRPRRVGASSDRR